ncbi:MAG: N-acetyl-gamma-glutamyl-phosphate reductase [Tannerella sp.]|jgi:N-acetyl-gamma-glutamyl-phosphate reductase|nr:N-acetyl-gamma-glutamyl-phosphate reductase [Tannerella sp.]
MIRCGIIGGAGYTAGELIRLLLCHPEAEITFVNSQSNAGNRLADVHEGLEGDTELRFTSELPFDAVDCLFFCTGHGDTQKFLARHELPKDLRVIDLSQDYRLEAEGNDFVYGLPELNRERIRAAKHIANPGCFATCIQLGLLPLAARKLLREGEVQVTALTGSTGAGVKPGPTSHFSWRMGNISVYKPFAHQHLHEIRQSLAQLQGSQPVPINFIPMRGDFARGIFASIYLDCPLEEEEACRIYTDFYDGQPFTHLSAANIDLKQVVNTNKCLLHVEKHGSKLLILSVIDNLLKGASGQAVHNMNLLFGLDETCGLRLKPSAF